MATVSLQTVFDEARRALEAGAADKAIGIAQHVLVHFPRMVEGYRLLGEAYLNASEHEQAVAAFEQVLRADPENIAAYYGLGLAQQSLDQRSAAIQAFERALEIQPNLADLRTQLMRLYSETPGSSGQFRLSRAGLGRLYARGGMFGQAIDEFRAVLDTDTTRDDVKVALAEALWRDGQEDEAMEYCRDILHRQFDLIKPTVLLAYMLFAAGQPEGEMLWRRAAEQDATMALARALFDILPPIRIEEPVLPEFDEAEWQAQAARRAAEQPVQAAVTANTGDDDIFADSWLGNTGASQPSSRVQIYDTDPAPTSAASTADAGDDDLLAALLGFDAPQATQPAHPTLDEPNNVHPFALDDWGDIDQPGHGAAAESLPSSLNDIGLPDTTPSFSMDNPGVKPFSLDDWSFDDDQPTVSSAQNAANDELDLPNISAFSLDEPETSDVGGARPFTLDQEVDTPSNIQPFSLADDGDDFEGFQPFSFESETQPTNTPSSDAGLGSVQPFSLDDWGDDDTTSSASLQPFSLNEPTEQPDQLNDLGSFKPFSLDELALDSLDNETNSSLAGPSVGGEADFADEPEGFSWEEPSWRSQSSSSDVDTSSGDTIFSKLMRSRATPPAEPPTLPPAEEAPADDVDDTFFSDDDIPLRIEGDAELQQNVTDLQQSTSGEEAPFTALEAQPAEANDQGVLGMRLWNDTETSTAGAQSDESDGVNMDDVLAGLFETQDNPVDARSNIGEPSSAGDDVLPQLDTTFSWDTPTTEVEQPATAGDNDTFSLSDLGFSEDELAALDIQPDTTSPRATQDDEADMLPFSLSDLGLTDDELAVLALQDDSDSEPNTPELNISAFGELPEQVEEPSPSVEAPTAASAEQPDDFVPFSLTDLGLTDEEIGLLQQDKELSEQVQSLEPMLEDDAEVNVGVGEEQPSQNDQLMFDANAAEEAEDSALGWLSQTNETDQEMPATQSVDQLPNSAEMSALDDVETTETSLFGSSLDDTSPDDAPPFVSFSPADLGLSDEEAAFFEQVQSAAPENVEPEAGFGVQEFPSDTDTSVTTDETFSLLFQSDDADVNTAEENDQNLLPTSSNVDPNEVETPIGEVPTEEVDLGESVPVVQPVAATYAEVPTSDAELLAVNGALALIQGQLAADPGNDELRLAVARMSQNSDARSQALEYYKQLIKRGALLDDVVADLQDAIVDSDEPDVLRRLHRLLGDAYMRQNRFREAMDEYSWTLARGK